MQYNQDTADSWLWLDIYIAGTNCSQYGRKISAVKWIDGKKVSVIVVCHVMASVKYFLWLFLMFNRNNSGAVACLLVLKYCGLWFCRPILWKFLGLDFFSVCHTVFHINFKQDINNLQSQLMLNKNLNCSWSSRYKILFMGINFFYLC